MADLIQSAQYFKLHIADKTGELARVLAPLHEAGVNLLAVHAFPRNRRTHLVLLRRHTQIFNLVVGKKTVQRLLHLVCHYNLDWSDKGGW